MEAQFAAGATIFVPSEEEGWAPLTVVECRGFGDGVTLRAAPLGDGPSTAQTLDKELIAQVQEADPLAMQGADDLVKFSKLSEATLLHNLRVRYSRDDIYTRAGAILISVNPFKPLSIYTPDRMAQCKDADAKALQELPPHVYVLAEAAFRGMLIEQKQQAILISGESGAGKTEAVKACLRYVVSRSSDAARGVASAPDTPRNQAKHVEDCIIQANPLLEALGNAKTVRNGNSSRFGKWVEVQFNASGFITASRVTSYLLEKSRVTEHGKGERTYHLMYQICRGCAADQASELRLPPSPDTFRYVGESAALRIPGVDDVEWWSHTCQAMTLFGLGSPEQGGLRAIVAAVLHIGNLEFKAVQIAQQDDGSEVIDSAKAHLQAVAELLALAPAALEQALTVKSVGKFPVVQVPQPPQKAAATRDALARALYGQLFEWTIARINTVMSAGAESADAKRTIGMLDIFGFESFATNSIEQLLINFANEKLQAHFNEYIFRLEEAECRAEGVACPVLNFADNSAVMALMTTKPTGVLSLINEEVLVPNASDVNLLQKLLQQHRSKAEFKPLPRAQGEGFIIQHYAGPVSYLIDGFVEKNRDQLPGELTQLVSSSKMPLLQAIFKPSATGDADGGAPKSARGGGTRGRAGAGGGGRRATALAAQFVDSLEALIGMLRATTPHFVRCVKPNYEQAAMRLDGSYVMRQLREMGMVHVVRARKQGFAHRYPFDRFFARYGYLLTGRNINPSVCASAYVEHLGSASPPEGERRDCVTVLAVMVSEGVLDTNGWAVGTGKVFLKEAQQQQLEVAREAYLIKVITEQLQAAIDQREVAGLESAIAAAVEVQLQSPLLGQAQKLLALLQQQLIAAAKLQEAIGARDIVLLDNALDMAGKVGLADTLVQQAQHLRSLLKSQQKATAALTEALERNQADDLEAALLEANQVGLNTGLVKEAERRLEGLRRAAELDQQLLAASEGDSLSNLVQLLTLADEIQLDTQNKAKAQQRRVVLQDGVRLTEALKQAMVSSDAAAIRSLVDRARTLAVQPNDLAITLEQAQRTAAELERVAADAAMAAAREQEQRRRDAEAAAARAAAEVREAEAAAAAARADEERRSQVEAAQAAAVPASPSPRGLSQSDERWEESVDCKKKIPCLPLAHRLELLKHGSTLIKLAEGRLTRSRYSYKNLQITQDERALVWDDDKKKIDLAQVQRVSVGMASKTLMRLSTGSSRLSAGASGSGPEDVQSHHWFSVWTDRRSYDFGVTDECVEEDRRQGRNSVTNSDESVVLWVLTLQQLIVPRLPPNVDLSGFLGLSNAQSQWQHWDDPSKQWPCFRCTSENPANSPYCFACEGPRPAVTLNPVLAPLLEPLKAIGNSLGVTAFGDTPESQLLCFLVRALESPLPPPFEWAARCRPSAPEKAFLVLRTNDGTEFEDANHPHLIELRNTAARLQAQVVANGVLDLSPFVPAPNTMPLDSPPSSSADDQSEVGTWRHGMAGEVTPRGLSQQDFEDLDESALDAATVFQYCMSGSVRDLQSFLSQGGMADSVYQDAYEWKVGPEYMYMKPKNNTTLLNYVASWAYDIGDTAPDLVRLLLQHGADMARDDAQEQWFTPLHNAVAIGASDVVEVMLDMHPEAIEYCTGEGSTALHVLSSCLDEADRDETLDLLLQKRQASGRTFEPNVNLAEPFCGDTALHAAAKEGHADVFMKLVAAGADATQVNHFDRTPLDELKAQLQQLEREGQLQTAVCRTRLANAVATITSFLEAPVAPQAPPQVGEWTTQMRELREMGFLDAAANQSALEAVGGDVSRAVGVLCA